MKLFAKLLLAALVLAVLLPFTILKDDSGNTLMSFSDFSLPDFSLPSVSDKLPDVKQITPGGNLLQGEDTVYQWRDDDGNLHFSTEPPAQGIEYEVRRFDPDANVIQSVKLPSGQKAEKAGGNRDAAVSAEPAEIGIPYTGESIQKLFEDARNLEKLLGQRFDDQEKAINQ